MFDPLDHYDAFQALGAEFEAACARVMTLLSLGATVGDACRAVSDQTGHDAPYLADACDPSLPWNAQ